MLYYLETLGTQLDYFITNAYVFKLSFFKGTYEYEICKLNVLTIA